MQCLEYFRRRATNRWKETKRMKNTTDKELVVFLMHPSADLFPKFPALSVHPSANVFSDLAPASI